MMMMMMMMRCQSWLRFRAKAQAFAVYIYVYVYIYFTYIYISLHIYIYYTHIYIYTHFFSRWWTAMKTLELRKRNWNFSDLQVEYWNDVLKHSLKDELPSLPSSASRLKSATWRWDTVGRAVRIGCCSDTPLTRWFDPNLVTPPRNPWFKFVAAQIGPRTQWPSVLAQDVVILSLSLANEGLPSTRTAEETWAKKRPWHDVQQEDLDIMSIWPIELELKFGRLVYSSFIVWRWRIYSQLIILILSSGKNELLNHGKEMWAIIDEQLQSRNSLRPGKP